MKKMMPKMPQAPVSATPPPAALPGPTPPSPAAPAYSDPRPAAFNPMARSMWGGRAPMAPPQAPAMAPAGPAAMPPAGMNPAPMAGGNTVPDGASGIPTTATPNTIIDPGARVA